MKHDFSNVPTATLANETMRRARGIGDVIEPVWATMPWAFVGAFLAVAASVGSYVAADTSWPWGAPLSAVALAATLRWGCWPLCRPWVRAMRECDAYTAELNARTTELKARNAARARR